MCLQSASDVCNASCAADEDAFMKGFSDSDSENNAPASVKPLQAVAPRISTTDINTAARVNAEVPTKNDSAPKGVFALTEAEVQAFIDAERQHTEDMCIFMACQKNANAHIPIIALTAQPEKVSGATATGDFTAILSKPVDRQTLISTLAKLQ